MILLHPPPHSREGFGQWCIKSSSDQGGFTNCNTSRNNARDSPVAKKVNSYNIFLNLLYTIIFFSSAPFIRQKVPI